MRSPVVQGKAKGPGKTSQPAKKVIHPKSREAKRQNRHMVRNEHVTKKKVDHAKILHTKRMCSTGNDGADWNVLVADTVSGYSRVRIC